MTNQIVELINKRMDDYREESNRRFDALDRDIKDIKKDVGALTQWRWTTKGKIAGMTLIGSGILTATIEICKYYLKARN